MADILQKEQAAAIKSSLAELEVGNAELWTMVNELQQANAELRASNLGLEAAVPLMEEKSAQLQAENQQIEQNNAEQKERLERARKLLCEDLMEEDTEVPLVEAYVRPWPSASKAEKGISLWAAVKRGDEWTVNRLIECGADINFKGGMYGSTPLQEAAGAGQLKILKLLIRRGAAVDARNHSGSSALHYSVIPERVDCLRALLEAGADINIKGRKDRTPLHEAVKRRRVRHITALMQAKALQYQRDINGRTPYELANTELLLQILP